MVESQPQRRVKRLSPQVPRGVISLAQRAAELQMSVAALRRYVNIGSVEGDIVRIGKRIYVSENLSATPKRNRISHLKSISRSRWASVTRKTSETKVTVELCLDGRGHYTIHTGNMMFDHLLAQLSRHSLIDMTISAAGDDLPDQHHLVEDVAITLGRTLRQALGEGRGIRRMGFAMVPLDETLARVVVDVGGRSYVMVETHMEGTRVGDFPGELIAHFMERLAIDGGLTLHAKILYGVDPHHKAEALFKALAKALRAAVEMDIRVPEDVPSTKGMVSEG